MTMTTAAPNVAHADPAPRRLWAFRTYAIICALIGLDLLLFPDWLAAQMIRAPIVHAIVDLATWFQGLGLATLLFAGGIMLAARRGEGGRLSLGPTMAIGAGASCLIAAAIGGSDLTGFGIAVLCGCAGLDFLFAVLMVRAGRG